MGRGKKPIAKNDFENIRRRMKTRFSARIQMYLRKYVKIFPQIHAHISRNSHAFFRKYVYVFAEINSVGLKRCSEWFFVQILFLK